MARLQGSGRAGALRGARATRWASAAGTPRMPDRRWCSVSARARASAGSAALLPAIDRSGALRARSRTRLSLPRCPARAPDTEEARAEFENGLEALRNDRWPEAELHFRRSLELVPRPSTTYDLAYAVFRQRRPNESLAL